MPYGRQRRSRVLAIAHVGAGLLACAGIGVSVATIALLLGVFGE